MDLTNLDWSALAHLMKLAGIKRLEFTLHKRRSPLTVLEYEDIIDHGAPEHEGMQGAFVVFVKDPGDE